MTKSAVDSGESVSLAEGQDDLEIDLGLVQLEGRFVHLRGDVGGRVFPGHDLLVVFAHDVVFEAEFVAGLFQAGLVVARDVLEHDLEGVHAPDLLDAANWMWKGRLSYFWSRSRER